jgi:quercetin dioxygenase-like cupin family protein
MIDSGALLQEESDRQEDRARQYTKRTENYAYTALTPPAENKHLKAFRILIEPMQDHKGVGYQHEGEEFVYVLSGKVEITVGEHRNRLTKGESLHFNSGITHHMKNIGKSKAQLIVTIYTP